LLANHTQGQCEWAISGLDAQGHVRNAVIDRYFVADQQRWIIDYKTAVPHYDNNQPAQEQFLQEQFLQEQRERYKPQLDRYKNLIGKLFADEPLPIRTALYFTGLDHLLEI
jgi:ATP-dependent exoDNAse (exonuclease V) beta subunit